MFQIISLLIAGICLTKAVIALLKGHQFYLYHFDCRAGAA